MKVRDPAAASSRLTRWNSWTDGESPDGKRTQPYAAGTRCVHQPHRRACDDGSPLPRAPGSAQDERGHGDDRQPGRARSDAARPGARRVSGRPARPEPAGRLRAAGPGRYDGRRGVPPRRRDRPRRGRRTGPGGERARGATAVVTLEPCNHTGRTGPCADALVAAGVARVVYAQGDTSPVATGGAETLRAAGVDVEGGLLADEARALNRVWTFAVEHRRPFVTWKFATTLDGRSAAADGTSRWVSSLPARRDTHRLRALCDTILVGTETVLVDDPQLTVRDEDDRPLPREQQLLRAVMGLREVPAGRRVLDDAAETVVLPTRDPRRGTGHPVRPGPAARLPRGRADAGRGVPHGRTGRRGGHLRRADAARRGPQRRRRPRHRQRSRTPSISTSPT